LQNFSSAGACSFYHRLPNHWNHQKSERRQHRKHGANGTDTSLKYHEIPGLFAPREKTARNVSFRRKPQPQAESDERHGSNPAKPED